MDPVIFWTAVGAIGTCIAAVATVIPILLLIKGRGVRAIQLEGRCKGDLGDEWDVRANLRVESDRRVEGHVHWKFIECPSSLPFANRVGANGSKLVEGELKRGILELSDKKIVSSDPRLFGLCDYKILLPTSGNAYEGRGEPQQKGGKYAVGISLRGTISFSRKPPPDSE